MGPQVEWPQGLGNGLAGSLEKQRSAVAHNKGMRSVSAVLCFATYGHLLFLRLDGGFVIFNTFTLWRYLINNPPCSCTFEIKPTSRAICKSQFNTGRSAVLLVDATKHLRDCIVFRWSFMGYFFNAFNSESIPKVMINGEHGESL